MTRFINYSNVELIRHCDNSMNNLTTTDLEKALCAKLCEMTQDFEANEGLMDALSKQGYDDDDADKLKADLNLLTELKSVLGDRDLPDDAQVLRKELESLATAREAIAEANEALAEANDALILPAMR